jgi:predicted amidohydrolase
VTRIGKIGVSICIENFIPEVLQQLHDLDVDMVLMPFSAPAPPTGTFIEVEVTDIDSVFFSSKSLPQYLELFKSAASHNAKLLGVPTVMANKCGVWTSTVPGIATPYTTDFLGFTTICDADGSTLAQVDNSAGEIVLVAGIFEIIW